MYSINVFTIYRAVKYYIGLECVHDVFMSPCELGLGVSHWRLVFNANIRGLFVPSLNLSKTTCQCGSIFYWVYFQLNPQE